MPTNVSPARSFFSCGLFCTWHDGMYSQLPLKQSKYIRKKLPIVDKKRNKKGKRKKEGEEKDESTASATDESTRNKISFGTRGTARQ